MNIRQNLQNFIAQIPKDVTLVAVSKTKPNEAIVEAYNTGHRHFGENRVQELTKKAEELPKDIHWHAIGHLQRNKVKYIAPFVHLIHSVDSVRLLKEINKQGDKNNRTINCLLQLHIAKEESKYGFSYAELNELIKGNELSDLENIEIKGLMGMATLTDDKDQIRREFKALALQYSEIKNQEGSLSNVNFDTLSMGMSGDYRIAIEEGSNMVRVGSAIFGERN